VDVVCEGEIHLLRTFFNIEPMDSFCFDELCLEGLEEYVAYLGITDICIRNEHVSQDQDVEQNRMHLVMVPVRDGESYPIHHIRKISCEDLMHLWRKFVNVAP